MHVKNQENTGFWDHKKIDVKMNVIILTVGIYSLFLPKGYAQFPKHPSLLPGKKRFKTMNCYCSISILYISYVRTIYPYSLKWMYETVVESNKQYDAVSNQYVVRRKFRSFKLWLSLNFKVIKNKVFIEKTTCTCFLSISMQKLVFSHLRVVCLLRYNSIKTIKPKKRNAAIIPFRLLSLG